MTDNVIIQQLFFKFLNLLFESEDLGYNGGILIAFIANNSCKIDVLKIGLGL